MDNRLLSTNAPPSEFEASEARKLLSEEQSQMNSIRTEIECLKAEYEVDQQRLEIKHKKRLGILKAAYETHKGRSKAFLRVLSPMRRLPQELLRHIFLLLHPHLQKRHWLMGYLDKPTALSPPLLLCSVCHRWRALAISIPQLWTHIRPSPEGEGCLKLLDLFLSRSQSNPLVFEMSEKYTTIERGGLIKRNMTAGLLNSARCIQRLKVFSWKQDTQIAQDLPPEFGTETQAPLLESLTVSVGSRWTHPSNFIRWIQDVCRTAPQLRTASLVGILGSPNFLPWNQLREVTLWIDFPLGDCIPLLANAAQIEEFRHSSTDSHTLTIIDTPSLPQHIILPSLRVVELYEATSISSFLQLFTSPFSVWTSAISTHSLISILMISCPSSSDRRVLLKAVFSLPSI